MKLLFRQRLFSWFDSYDIYDEAGESVFTVEGQLSWGHCLHILDQNGVHVGTVRERVMSLLPRFELYEAGNYLGSFRKELTFLRPRFELDFNGWTVQGEVFEWDYRIWDRDGRQVATVSKELFHLTDTYVIDVADPEDALHALMVVLAIDAEKCSRGD
ncbi:MAG: LURP-one-related family protein [Clostridiales bacterium]|nr:LURP-one-related family protein [Clostridiales bacterium]